MLRLRLRVLVVLLRVWERLRVLWLLLLYG
jgi:hypothetical protein